MIVNVFGVEKSNKVFVDVGDVFIDFVFFEW